MAWWKQGNPNLELSFKDAYSAFIAGLNKSNSSHDWWALNFTNKNPIATPLCNQIYNVWAERTAGREIESDPKNFIVRFYQRLRRILPLGPATGFMRMCWLKVFSSFFGPQLLFAKGEPVVVLFSLFNHQSFADGKVRDAYFGDLPSELKQKGIPFVLMGQTMQHPAVTLRDLAKSGDGYPIVPMESIQPWGALFKNLFHSFFRFLFPPVVKGPCEIKGLDCRDLVRETIRENVSSSRFFTDLCFESAMEALCSKIKVKSLIYPFENRAWEKMLLSALRKSAPSAEAVGYNHASLTPKHLNFVFEKGEMDYTPQPDRIVAMGEMTRDFMVSYGHYAASRIDVGCALRKNKAVFKGLKSQPKSIRNILVALATDYREYRGVFSMLEKFSKGRSGLTLHLRPHPVYPLKTYHEQYGPIGFPYIEDKDVLSDSLLLADVVLYASSTLGIDALEIGIPAIYLDWGDYMNVDPLANLMDWKWSASDSSQLSEIFKEIESMENSKLIAKQEAARRYCERYAVTPTAENIKSFIPRSLNDK